MNLSISFAGITHRYGATTALQDVTLTLAGGAIHGLLGRNGSGKTTLLSLAAAFSRPTSGAVLVDGEPVFEHAEITSRICLIRGAGDTVGQDWPSDRIGDALAFATIRETWDARYAAELLDRFELAPTERVSQLSKGQRAALGVVLGLASRAPLTMFDETHLGMDVPSRYAFYDELLRDAMAHPRTFVLSTHHVEEVSAMFGHVTILDRGRVLLHEEAETLRARGAIVTGPARAVEVYTADRRVLEEKRLGRTASAVLYGELGDEDRAEAEDAGLDVGPLPLQDLFVHLTAPRTVHA